MLLMLVALRAKYATLSSSCYTFKLDYVCAEWLKGDRSGFYYSEPVAYVGYDGYVKCRRHPQVKTY